jgi:hypothetical protein
MATHPKKATIPGTSSSKKSVTAITQGSNIHRGGGSTATPKTPVSRTNLPAFTKVTNIRDMNLRVTKDIVQRYATPVSWQLHNILSGNGENNQCFAQMLITVNGRLERIEAYAATPDLAFNHMLELARDLMAQLGVKAA